MLGEVRISSTEDGLRLNDSILSFDSCHSQNVSFISSALSPHAQVSSSIIASNETFAIYQAFRRKLRGLKCEFHKKIAVGQLSMELLPSGGVLGGASLYVEFPDFNLLYAPLLRSKRVLNFRSMQLRGADVLVLGAFNSLAPREALSRQEEVKRFIATIRRDVMGGRSPSVICPPVDLAPEMTVRLQSEGVGVTVHPTIARVNRVYERFGTVFSDYAYEKDAIVRFYPLSRYLQAVNRIQDKSPIYLLKNSFQESKRSARFPFADRFLLSAHSTLCEVKAKLADIVAPQKILVFGPYTKQYVEELSTIAGTVKPLFQNNQPPLF